MRLSFFPSMVVDWRSLRLRVLLFDSSRWLCPDLYRFSFPLPVTFTRLVNELFVFILGIFLFSP
jgi:hypothetical protein